MAPHGTRQTTLTRYQLDEYQRNGFVVAERVFERDELENIDREIDRLQAQKRHTGRNRGWMMQLGLQSPLTRDFAQDERLLDLVTPIVYPGIAIFSAKLVAKLPRSREICHWHQDDAYYVQHSQSRRRASVWLPLQDSNQDNGCLWVVPGSHRHGLQSYSRQEHGQCRLAMDPEGLDLSTAVPCPARAGSVIVFSALLWHHSKGNQTDRIRRACIVSYQEATVTGGNKDQWKVLRPA